MDRRAVSLKPLIKEIIGTRSDDLKGRDLRVMTNYPAENVKAEVDRKAFSEVMSTLMDRSINDSPIGGQVILDLEDREKDVMISISDAGEGLPEEDLKHLLSLIFWFDLNFPSSLCCLYQPLYGRL